MYKHIVMWKFRDGTEAEARAFIDALNGLLGVIPELLSAEAALNQSPENGLSGVLISTFADEKACECYKNDPRHKAVSAMCKAIRISRDAVDYLQ